MINLALGLGISISIFLYQKPYFLSIMEEHFLVQNSQDLCLLQDFFLTSFHQKVFKSLAKKTVETDADKMRLVFFFIVFLKFMVMPLSVCILKVHTLTIPKW